MPSFKETANRVWRFMGHLSVIYTLWTVGLGAALGAVLTLFTDLPATTVFFIVVAAGCLSVASIQTVSHRRNRPRLEPPPRPRPQPRSSRPVKASKSAAGPRPRFRKPEKFESMRSPDAALRGLLTEKLKEGENLKERLKGAFFNYNPAQIRAAGGLATEDDVAAWESHVLDLLRDHPEHAALFGSEAGATALVMDPLRFRIDHRLLMLDEIIKRLPE